MVSRILCIMTIVFAALAGVLSANDFIAPIGDWSNPANWSPASEPGANTDAIVDSGHTVQITQNGEVCYLLNVGTQFGGAGYVEMSGGDIYAATYIYIGYTDCYGSFIQSGGTNKGKSIIMGRNLVGGAPDCDAYYRLEGGTFDVEYLYLGYLDTTAGRAVLEVSEPNQTLKFRTALNWAAIGEYYAEPNTTLFFDAAAFTAQPGITYDKAAGLQNTRFLFADEGVSKNSLVEALGDDLGATMRGFQPSNFVIKQWDIGGAGFAGHVIPKNTYMHGDIAVTDAVYVETLNISAGSILDLAYYGINLYYNYGTIHPGATIIGPERLIQVEYTEHYCEYPPEYDYNGDCVVNLGDVAIFASKWLECGFHLPEDCP